MSWENILAFILGFVAATVLIVGVGFFWLKRRWKTLLFGLGSKLFGKGVQHMADRAKGRAGGYGDEYKEIGRQ